MSHDRALARAAPVAADPDADAARLAQTLLRWACAAGASALHLQRGAADARIVARIDGDLRHVAACTPQLLDAIAPQLVRQALAPPAGVQLDDLIARHAFTAMLVPVSGPGPGGPGRALRLGIRDRGEPCRSLAELGLAEREHALLAQVVRQPQGLVLVAGPARSGKTTTLYALLEAVDPLQRLVHTVEAPVARRRPRWLQHEAGPEGQGLCADRVRAALSAVLSDDPGALLVDASRLELPAPELLGAVAAGWLVVCPVACERAHEAFAHFQALGVAPAELARHLALVIAQRLVRRLCPACAVPDASPEMRSVLARAANSWLAGVPVKAMAAAPGGCAACAGRGYRGRLLLAEVLDVDAGVRALAADACAGHAMERSLYAEGQSLWDQGIGLLAAGCTSLQALRSVLREPR